MKKNTFKFIGIIAALVLLLQTVTVCSANDTEITAVDKKVTDRLMAFGIIGHVQNASDPISRAQMAQLALQSVGDSYYGIGGTDEFSDVPSTHNYYESVNAAKALGIILGNGQNMFYPDVVVQKTEAMVMLLRAAAYSQLAEAKGGYPNGYVSVASEIGLMKNVSSNNELNYGDVINMISNILDAKSVDFEYSQNTMVSYSIDKSITNIEKFFNVTKKRGKVKDIDFISKKVSVLLLDDTTQSYYVADKNLLYKVGGNMTLYIENDNDSVAFYIEMKADTNVFYDYINEVNKSSKNIRLTAEDIKNVCFTNENKLYDVADDVDVYYNDKKITNEANEYINCFARVVVNENNIIRMDVYKLCEGGLIYRADKNELRFTRGELYENSVKGFENVSELQIIIDGQVSENMFDLKTDMTFDYWTCGEEKCIIVASSRCVKGVVDGYSNDSIKVDGEDYILNSQFGYYNYDAQEICYKPGGDFSKILNQPVEIFIDDNRLVRYIRIDTAKMKQKTFNGVVIATSDDSIESNKMVRICKVDGNFESIDYKVSNKLPNDSLSFNYLKTVEKNLDALGFLNFTVNDNNEIIKISKVPYFGYSTTKSDHFIEDYLLNEQYIREAIIFAIMEIDGEFVIKPLDYTEDIEWTKPATSLTAISDYDIKENPVPNYVAFTAGSDDMSFTSPYMSVVKSIVYAEDDMRILALANGDTYTVSSEFITTYNLKPGILIEYYSKYTGKYPIKVLNTRDLSGDCELWATDTFSTTATSGFFRADEVVLRNDYIIQFKIDGEPTDVYRFYDDVNHGRATVYEYTGRSFIEKKGVPGVGTYEDYVRSTKRYPYMYIQKGDTAWFHLTNLDSKRKIDYIIYKSNDKFFDTEGE